MTDTPNHGYHTPSKGTEDWHVQLNDNFENIDTDVEIRDTESNKGEYEPKQGAKYEATDSGAVYQGNGTSWVLVNREVNKLQTKNINDSWLTPQNSTIQAIQDLVDEYRNPNIRLKPGTLYEGDTQLYLDSSPPNGKSKRIRINADSAGVNYTGSKQYAVRVEQGNVLPSEEGINDDANDDNAGSIEIVGGTWSGPGKDITNSAVFAQNPCHNILLSPTKLGEATHGILVKWKNGWNEGCHWKVQKRGSYNGEMPDERPTHLIRLAGSSSELATDDWTAGGGGRSSGRNSYVTIEYKKAANGDGGATLWQDNVALHGGEIRMTGFLPRGGSGYRLTGRLALNKTCTIYFECEGWTDDAVAIDMQETGVNTPLFINPRIHTNGKVIEENTGNGFRAIRNGIFQTYGRRSEWSIRGKDNYNGHRFLQVEANDGGFKYGFSEKEGSLALVDDSYVSAVDKWGNSFVPLRGSEHRSIGSAGERSYKGTFDDHPSASNGDTWYITGNGEPVEGFYGQTSSDIIQLG